MSLKTEFQRYIHQSRYARYRDDLGRRETWEETVERYQQFFEYKLVDEGGWATNSEPVCKLRNCIKSILDTDIMPSMRALMTAGPALERDNVAGYNCAYLPVDSPRAFDEAMYILLCGTGVGFSVERQYISELPTVPEKLENSDTVISVGDSKRGWAFAFRELLGMLYSGTIPSWDLSKIRPKGSRLKTFGGRASGPEPLDELFRFTVGVFKGACGRKLSSIECHDIMCKIGDIVVVGGVRRSALISLSNLTDDRMRRAKYGDWYNTAGYRRLANNSVAYTEKPDMAAFMKEWMNLYESKSGERGIFYRRAAKRKAEESGRRDPDWEFGTNPCSEIILRPNQFCNLTEVVVKPGDRKSDLVRKVQEATFLGTLQSTLTHFPYLRKKWANNCEEERLLGVSLTGVMDHPVLSNKDHPQIRSWLRDMKEAAIEANKYWADILGINQSTAITCVKPSGTVSQLVDSASGLHPRYSRRYVRTVRADKTDPLARFMVDKGFPVEDDVMAPESTYVFSFPMESPKNSVTSEDMDAIDQLETWKLYNDEWCEHKPSVSIYVQEHEWLSVAAWVYDNFDDLSGISFFPYSDHVYKQAPYQDTNQEGLRSLERVMPKGVDWSEMEEYEDTDNTTGSQEYACVGGSCDVV